MKVATRATSTRETSEILAVAETKGTRVVTEVVEIETRETGTETGTDGIGLDPGTEMEEAQEDEKTTRVDMEEIKDETKDVGRGEMRYETVTATGATIEVTVIETSEEVAEVEQGIRMTAREKGTGGEGEGTRHQKQTGIVNEVAVHAASEKEETERTVFLPA
jgi:hypothetical protein